MALVKALSVSVGMAVIGGDESGRVGCGSVASGREGCGSVASGGSRRWRRAGGGLDGWRRRAWAVRREPLERRKPLELIPGWYSASFCCGGNREASMAYASEADPGELAP